MKLRLLLIIPIYNEEADLERSLRRLHAYASQELTPAYDWQIMVGDNASTDRSPEIYRQLAAEDKRFTFRRIEEKGRGRMLRHIWLGESYDISLYMDVDLATDLRHVAPVVDSIRSGRADIAIGRRLGPGAKVIGRPLLREITSRGYIQMVRLLAGSPVRDFQCGFKGISRPAALALLPHVKDTGWFFDTELLVLAGKSGYRVHQEPVIWTDDPISTVRIWKTAKEDVKGLLRMRREKAWRGISSK